jgi:hypothetical protein
VSVYVAKAIAGFSAAASVVASALALLETRGVADPVETRRDVARKAKIELDSMVKVNC